MHGGCVATASDLHAMKEKLASALRHALTFLPALGAFFVSKGWLTADEGAQLDKELIDFLTVVAGLVAAVLSRLVMFLVAKYAPHFSGFLGGGSGGSSAGPMMVILTAAAIGGSLPSCTPAQPSDATPLLSPLIRPELGFAPAMT